MKVIDEKASVKDLSIARNIFINLLYLVPALRIVLRPFMVVSSVNSKDKHFDSGKHDVPSSPILNYCLSASWGVGINH